jgi:hypothetical protein
MAVQLVPWREGIRQDMFIDHISVRILFENKPHHSFSTSYHCYKTGNDNAEIEAVLDKVIEELGGRKFEKIEIEHNGLTLVRLPYKPSKNRRAEKCA